jgi:hypothetical protein
MNSLAPLCVAGRGGGVQSDEPVVPPILSEHRGAPVEKENLDEAVI